MNRMLLIPAICCVSAFAVVLLVFHTATGRETATPAGRGGGDNALSPVAIEDARTPSAGDIPRSASEPEQLLQKLSDEYVRPWRQWQNSPHRLYSRAAPRPVPSIFAEIAVSPQSAGQRKDVSLATITIRTGLTSDAVPCIVDRTTGLVHLFAAGKWLPSDEWLKTAPTPGKVAMRD
jgi:hypothetical protein